MHRQRIAHLDISLHNFLTDHEGHYACIDYEQSRRYDNSSTVPQMQYYRAAEIPPELERGESSDPFKVDVWALGVFILRACKVLIINYIGFSFTRYLTSLVVNRLPCPRIAPNK